jgi:hypothetical protein
MLEIPTSNSAFFAATDRRFFGPKFHLKKPPQMFNILSLLKKSTPCQLDEKLLQKVKKNIFLRTTKISFFYTTIFFLLNNKILILKWIFPFEMSRMANNSGLMFL